MTEPDAKTLVVGFDALDFAYLDRFADSLPNFQQVRSDAAETPLASTHPPWTGSAWPSMYTGTGPSHHGVYDFFNHEGYPDEAEVVTREDVRQPALWNYLSETDQSSIVLNVPVTHPGEEMDGVLIPGYLAPEDAPGTPDCIRTELSNAIDEEYTIYSRAETGADKDEKLAGYLDLVDRRGQAARYLLEERSWDLGIVQVQKTDAVFHNFDDEDAFRQVYRAADAFLGTVLDAVEEPVNVIVCSDHGIGPKQGYAIYVNEILRSHGLVEGTTEGSEGSSLSSVKTQLTDDTTATGSGGGAASGPSDSSGAAEVAKYLSTGLRRAGVSPADAYGAAMRLGLGPLVDRAIPSEFKSAAAETVDWRASAAFVRSKAELGVRINLAGRESSGVVPQSEYESVRDEIIELLEAVKTPDGEAAFERVARREEVYDGPYAEDACDVVFVPTAMNHTVGTKLYGREFVPVDLYDHEREGVFLASGPDIRGEAGLDGLSLTDVAPVVMALLGHSVPERMTGEVPDGLVEPAVDRTDYGDVPFGMSAEEADGDGDSDDAVTERLEDLGYL